MSLIYIINRSGPKIDPWGTLFRCCLIIFVCRYVYLRSDLYFLFIYKDKAYNRAHVIYKMEHLFTVVIRVTSCIVLICITPQCDYITSHFLL